MKCLTSVLVLIASLVLAVQGSLQNRVLELDIDTFWPTVSEHPTLTLFYAPWCGHCKKAKPEFEQAATTAATGRANFAQIDCNESKNKPICTSFNVRGYPTIIYIDSEAAKMTSFKGPRNAEGFRTFAQTAVPDTPLPSKDVKAAEPSAEKKATAPIVANTRYGTRPIPNEVIDLNGSTFADQISNQNTLVLFYAPWCGHCKKAKPLYADAAKKASSGPAAFAQIDCTDASNKSICTSFQIKGYPTIFYFDAATKTYVEYNGARDADSFYNFTLKAKGNKQIPSLDSQSSKPSKPEVISPNKKFGSKPIANEVKELNVGNFASTIAEENTIVMFYAPWCGHCKNTKPHYEQAASQASQGPAQFARIDCNEADNKPICTAFNVPGYPTIVYIDAHNKKYAEYEGERDAKSFTDFTYTAKSTITLPQLPNGSSSAGPSTAQQSTQSATPNKPLNSKNIRNEVVDLNVDNFYETISAENSLVFFYAPWCGHCKKTKPHYEQAATKADQGAAQFTRIDCNDAQNKPVCSAFQIRGYPTIIYIDARTKKYVEFNGEREASAFFKFALTAKGTTSLPSLPEPATASNSFITGFNSLLSSLRDDFETLLGLRKSVALLLLGFGFFFGYFARGYLNNKNDGSTSAKKGKKAN